MRYRGCLVSYLYRIIGGKQNDKPRKLNKKEVMGNFIRDYLCQCEYKTFDCIQCKNIEECYMDATQKCNEEYAESIGFGGYNSADEFWDNLFD